MRPPTIAKPILRADSTCPDCARVWTRCAWHLATERQREDEKSAILRAVCQGNRAYEIGRICARYELESDEGGTAYEKGARILDGKDTTPRW